MPTLSLLLSMMYVKVRCKTEQFKRGSDKVIAVIHRAEVVLKGERPLAGRGDRKGSNEIQLQKGGCLQYTTLL